MRGYQAPPTQYSMWNLIGDIGNEKNEKVDMAIKDVKSKGQIKENQVEEPKGRITEITISKTIQDERYEPIRIELTSTVGETEDVEDVHDYLKETVMYLINK